ncbi:hypothetical protein CP533_0260 [Ophiocordyceps camponoti-saundersi (nom. inval.)]|nr:hypothetical protein CP533_0260 [Ophiocordyceps camponoti-saundersi (nom. inval.)]
MIIDDGFLRRQIEGILSLSLLFLPFLSLLPLLSLSPSLLSLSLSLHLHFSAMTCAVANTIDAYLTDRDRILELERDSAFDARCRARATPLEVEASRVVAAVRRRDESEVYGAAPARTGHAGQRHRRFPGDRFLTSLDLIDEAALMHVARRLPKGAHLHVHFNACLPPRVLLDMAKTMDRMFVTSDMPLVSDDDYASFDRCQLQFSILAPADEHNGDVFATDYEPRQTMSFAGFLSAFPRHYPYASPDSWLERKLIFSPEETYGPLQTSEGAWDIFNGRTRMMKGLFNYETAYRNYTRLFLEDLVRDNILYAEIRPNFMRSNQLYRDDGSGLIDNAGIMHIIIDVVTQFRTELEADGRYFGGLKVIYCTPRISTPNEIEAALDECLAFKKLWPEWIAGGICDFHHQIRCMYIDRARIGFDLVGQESRGRPLKCFISELLAFRKKCDAQDIEIPFLFHCGETLDLGTEIDENLVDALLLGAKRIGHGFALPRHPRIMEQMKARGVCIELCPISNEVLGLTPRIGGHALYTLLANDVHCTVNSDNGTLFRYVG